MKRNSTQILILLAIVALGGCASTNPSLRSAHSRMHIPIHSGACILKHFYLEEPDTDHLWQVSTDPADPKALSFVRIDVANSAVLLRDSQGELSVPVFSNDFPNLQMELDSTWKYGDETTLLVSQLAPGEELQFPVGTVTQKWAYLNNTRPPHKVSVATPTTVMFDGVICRLLGVRKPESPDKASRAMELLKDYLEWSAGYLSIYNSSSPLFDSDGRPVVWIIGHSNEGPMSVGLVRAGLSLPDLDEFTAYTFTMWGKDGPYDARWKAQLEEARRQASAGAPPRFIFEKRVPSKAKANN